MSNELLILFSFLLFMGIFAGVGIASMRVKQDTTDDYLVAGRGMHPALAALSAVSTWNSGYMFIGFIGFIFVQGYSAIWIALVSTIGQLVAWIWLYKYIQKEGNERNLRSLSSLVSSKIGAPEAKLAAVLSVFFLAFYAAAQLTAGGVALNSMLKWPETIGILIGFVLVVAYCYAGGIRASIWTDAAQSTVMIIGSTILCLVAIGKVGGLGGLHDKLNVIDSDLVNIYPSGLAFGATLWVVAFFLGGLGVAGQPQVVSRVMTLKDDSDRKQAMVWFFVWQTPFIALMFLIGLACRAIFNGIIAPEDAQTGLPELAQSLNPILGGVILASIFAATMSTADSQVLACTAAITDDIKPEWNQDHGKTKIVTLAIAALATGISLVGQLFTGFGDSVFVLVVFAVYGLGGIFIPLILIRMMGYEPDSKHSISMMVAALLGVLVWTIALVLSDNGDWPGGIFPSVPGIGAAFAVHFAFCFRHEKDDARSNPFGRYSMPTRKITAVATASLLCFVVVIESSYSIFSPEEEVSESGNAGYQLNYSVIQSIKTETLTIGNGESVSVNFEVPETSNAVISVSLFISYGETANEGVTTACDEVFTTPDFSDANGPHDTVNDSPSSTTNCDGSDQLMASVITNSNLSIWAENGTGEYSLNGTDKELNEIRESMGDSFRMQGFYSSEIAVDTNHPIPGFNDPGETITITWISLTFSPEEVKLAL